MKLDFDWVIPGHSEVVTIDYLARQRANLVDWARPLPMPSPRAGAARNHRTHNFAER